MITQYIDEIKKYPPLDREEENRLILLAKQGQKWASNKVINSNLRFVFQIAKSYQNRGLLLEDLIAEGNIGLLKALERFDPAREVKFISYAVWWIRQSILSAIYTYASPIRLPLNKLVNVSKINKIKDELGQDLLREPTYEELKESILDPALKEDIDHLHTIIRIDVPRTEEGDSTLHEVLEQIDEESIDDRFTAFAEDLTEIIKSFSKREQEILCMYYGIGHEKTYNLREIGVKLNLTRERIRQIKEQTLEKIKKMPEGQALIEYLS